MTLKTQSAAGQRTATRAARRTGPDPVAKAVLYGIVVFAIARLPWDRRFQRNVITAAIALAALSGFTSEHTARSVNAMTRFTERNYLREKRRRLQAGK